METSIGVLGEKVETEDTVYVVVVATGKPMQTSGPEVFGVLRRQGPGARTEVLGAVEYFLETWVEEYLIRSISRLRRHTGSCGCACEN